MAPAFFSRSQVNLAEGKGLSQRPEPASNQRQSLSARRSDSSSARHASPAPSPETRPSGSFARSATGLGLPKWNLASPERRKESSKGRVGPSDNSMTGTGSSQRRGHFRSKSKALLDSLLSSSSSSSSGKAADQVPTFEVIRPSRDVQREKEPGLASLERPTSPALVGEFGSRVGQDSAIDAEGAATSASANRRSRQISNPPSSLRGRGPFDALSRRMSALSVVSLTAHSPGQGAPLGAEAANKGASGAGTFTLHSMRNVRHGSSNALEEPDLSYFTVSPGGAPPSSDEVFLPVSPPLSPTFDEPLSVHDLTAPTSPAISARRLYMEPTAGSSSISVAKFRAGRNRSESGTYMHADLANGITTPRSGSPGPSLALQSAVMTPSEQLAILEAELARGGRATPLLRHLEAQRMPRTRENSVQSEIMDCIRDRHANVAHDRDPPSMHADGDPEAAPDVPAKDYRLSSRASRQGLPVLAAPFNPGTSSNARDPRRRFSDRYGTSHVLDASAPYLTQGAGGQAGREVHASSSDLPSPGAGSRASSPSLPRGRGMDAASFLNSVSGRLENGRPKTLLDALSQIENERLSDKSISAPAKPWLAGHGEERATISPSPLSGDAVLPPPSTGGEGQITAPTPLALGTPPVTAVEAGVVAQASRAAFQPQHRLPAVEVLPPGMSTPVGGQVVNKTGSLPINRSALSQGTALGNSAQPKVSAPTASGFNETGYFDMPARDISGAHPSRVSTNSTGTPTVLHIAPSNLVVVNASPDDSKDEEEDRLIPATKKLSAPTAHTLSPLGLSAERWNTLDTPEVARKEPVPSGTIREAPSVLPQPTEPSLEVPSAPQTSWTHRKALSVGSTRRRSEEVHDSNHSTRIMRTHLAPTRASTLSAPRREASTASSRSATSAEPVPHSTSKSAELLSFHAKQARSIALAQASVGASSFLALPETYRANGAPPPGVDPALYSALLPQQRRELQDQHEQAVFAARVAYQQAYDSRMGPVIDALRTTACIYPAAAQSADPTLWDHSRMQQAAREQAILSERYQHLDAPSGASHASDPRNPSIKYTSSPTGFSASALPPSSLLTSSPSPGASAAHGISRAYSGHSEDRDGTALHGAPDTFSATVGVSRRPSARFMAPPPTDATLQPPLPAIEGYAASSGGGGGSLSGHTGSTLSPPSPARELAGEPILTDELKRRTAARGEEPGEYSATKRNID
ncbi:unnamed protein product [Parajaminaea phylloscopi]